MMFPKTAVMVTHDISEAISTSNRVLVLSSHRRKGLAKQMMDCAIDFIKVNLHENNITLSAQTYIKNLYLSCGFKEISEVYDEAGIEHIKMRL